MSTTIAISGKGGSGKTTLAAMLIRYLRENCSGRVRPCQSVSGKSVSAGVPPKAGAILAVDADPNSCLGAELGVEPAGTIAEIREQTRSKSTSSGGTDRLRSFEYGIQQAITEASGFDLLTMGRPEGPGCYCAANNMLRTFLDKLSSQYQFVIIDNEAGMEHLSRRTTNNVDLLCIVAEQTSLGVVTAQRISELAKQLPILVKETAVIWNETRPSILDSRFSSSIQHPVSSIQLGCIPFDQSVFDASMQGKTVFELEGDSPAFLAVREIFEQKLTVNP